MAIRLVVHSKQANECIGQRETINGAMTIISYYTVIFDIYTDAIRGPISTGGINVSKDEYDALKVNDELTLRNMSLLTNL